MQRLCHGVRLMNLLHGFVLRIILWSIRVGGTRRLLIGQLLADLVLALAVFYLAGPIGLGRHFTPAALVIMAGVVLAGHVLAGTYLAKAAGPRIPLLKIAVGNVLAGVAYSAVRVHLHAVVSSATFAEILLVFFPLQAVLHAGHRYLQGRSYSYPSSLSAPSPLLVCGRGVGSPLKWMVEAERTGRWAFTLLLADALIVASTASVTGAFWLERTFDLRELLTIASITVAAHVLALSYAHRLPLGRVALIGKICVGNILAWSAWIVLHGRIGVQVAPATFAMVLCALTPVQMAFHFWHRREELRSAGRVASPLQWAMLLAAALALHRPLLTNGSTGAGDSYWYSIMVADFVSQWRAGVFPVLIGQSEFAFNGAVSPIRLAPGLQHMAGFIDLATFHSLPFYGILNLTLVSSFTSGMLVCYACLRAIEPRAPWLNLWLSMLFGGCPGVLALAYTGDLFLSITTLPFVPLLMYGAWRTLTQGDLKAVLIMVSAAAALWYCHPPIALWGTVVAAITQFVRLFRDGKKRETWRQWLIGACVFGLLSSYCFVSVGSLDAQVSPANRLVLVENLKQAFPEMFKPVFSSPNTLGCYQLGWSLWGTLLAGTFALVFRRPRLAGAGLLAAVLVLLAFLLPVPWLLDHLWAMVPQVVCDITYMWPTQRFHVLLAALTVFIACATLGPVAARHRWLAFVLGLLLVQGVAWTGREALEFHGKASLGYSPPAQAREMHLPQNRVMTRYSFNSFPNVPSYYSHGFIDPQLQNRLLDSRSLAELVSNRGVIENDSTFGIVRAEGYLNATRPDPATPSLALLPNLRLEPHRRYALRLDFEHPEFNGAMKVIGSSIFRLYWMPDPAYGMERASGPSRAFGALPSQLHTLTLWTDQQVPDDLHLQFFFSGDGPAEEVKHFAHYTLREFDPAQLPISVEGWIPYQARVKAPVDAYLETPRIFIKGYQARVNGRSVTPTKSPDSLVMVPVPAGNNVVELSFRGTLALRSAYYLSLTGWIALLLIATGSIFRRQSRRTPA